MKLYFLLTLPCFTNVLVKGKQTTASLLCPSQTFKLSTVALRSNLNNLCVYEQSTGATFLLFTAQGPDFASMPEIPDTTYHIRHKTYQPEPSIMSMSSNKFLFPVPFTSRHYLPPHTTASVLSPEQRQCFISLLSCTFPRQPSANLSLGHSNGQLILLPSFGDLSIMTG